MVRLTHNLDMTIVVDWVVKPQNKQIKMILSQIILAFVPVIWSGSRKAVSQLDERTGLIQHGTGVYIKKQVQHSFIQFYSVQAPVICKQ